MARENFSAKAARRFVVGVLCATLCLLLLCAGTVYSIDPYQQYRQMTLFVPEVDETMQAYYNIGMARNYEYTSLLIGSSMTENSQPSQVEQLWGGKAINLPFSGGTFAAYAKILSAAFETRQLDRVILCLDVFALAEEPDKINMHLPGYLYDQNPFSDVYYLLSKDSLEAVYQLIDYNTNQQHPPALDLDFLYEWDSQATYDARNVLLMYSDLYEKEKSKSPLSQEGKTQQLHGNLTQSLLPFIMAHPETTFYFYFPPYSQLQWYSDDIYGTLDRNLYYRQYFADALLAYENVQLFDFAAYGPWVIDLNLYKDMAHHNADINWEIIENLYTGQMRITDSAQLKQNNQAIRSYAQSFVPPTPQELAQMQEEFYASRIE